jgi:acetyltransferase-like isoleucine patch superfamily enzyme
MDRYLKIPRKNYAEKSFLKIIFNKYILFFSMLPMTSDLRKKLYRNVGIKIGKNGFIASYVLMDDQYPELITIEDNVTISYRATILTHDDSKGIIIPVRIEQDAWIGACTTILPGVIIGRGSVIGAGTTVSEDVPPNAIFVGGKGRYITKE